MDAELCGGAVVGLARKAGPCMRKQLGVGQKSAEGIDLDPRAPLGRGRPERDAQVRACLTSLRQVGSAEPEPQGGQSSAAASRRAGLDGRQCRVGLKRGSNRPVR